jgi:DNA-3-methyladenine glycosylase II
MRIIETEEHIAEAVAALKAADPRLGLLIEAAGPLPLRRRAGGFAGLVAIIVSQQLSRASADAIHGRLGAAIGPPTPDAVAATPDAALAAAGLSRPKIRALRAAAAAVNDGIVDLDALVHADDAAVAQALCRITGVGPWTADIYLLACLGRADVFPAGDLALQEAARIGLRLAARPGAAELLAEAERWRPWRSVAAILLWAYYRRVRRERAGGEREQGRAAG